MPPCDWMGNTSGSIMVLSFSQKVMKEASDKQDLRGGGLPGPIETEVWKSQKEAGIGDCWKSPTMAH